MFGAIATEYGNYYGATGLYSINADGTFDKKVYDYSVDPVDAVDNFAMIHDQAYDNLQASGENGLFDDWGTTPADEAAVDGWKSVLNFHPAGSKDPFNGQQVTNSERTAASNGVLLFSGVINNKKSAISSFMIANHSEQTHKNSRVARMGVKMFNEVREYNYQQFLNLYMHKDKNGKWTRNDGMWSRDQDGNWTPNTPVKTK